MQNHAECVAEKNDKQVTSYVYQQTALCYLKIFNVIVCDNIVCKIYKTD